MVNISTNTNKTNNYISPQLIDHKHIFVVLVFLAAHMMLNSNKSAIYIEI
jgi:hypothetical protein